MSIRNGFQKEITVTPGILGQTSACALGPWQCLPGPVFNPCNFNKTGPGDEARMGGDQVGMVVNKVWLMGDDQVTMWVWVMTSNLGTGGLGSELTSVCTLKVWELSDSDDFEIA